MCTVCQTTSPLPTQQFAQPNPSEPISGGGETAPTLEDSLVALTSALAQLTAALEALTGAQLVQPPASLTAAQATTPTPTPVTGSGLTTPTYAAPVAGAGANSGSTQSNATSNAKRGVLLIGDSLSVGTKQYLNSDLAGQPVTVDATGGISLAEGMRRYNATKDKPRVVEMALFTNNDPGQTAQLKSALEQTIKDARERDGKVVWATIERPGNYDAANAMIRDYAKKNPDVMGLVDWEKMVKDNPSYLAGDKVHGTAAGYKARAQAFADAAK